MGNALQATHRHLFAKHRFWVPIDRLGESAWKDCTGLDFTIARIDYFEGGANTAFKEGGRQSFEDLVLSRGVSYDEDILFWLEEVVDIEREYPYGAGDVSPAYKRNLRVQQLERNRAKAFQFQVFDAFPVQYSPSAFDNDTDEINMEQVTLTYHYHKRKNLGTPPSATAP